MTTTAEQAVRDYLTYLRDPDSLRDDAAITELEEELEVADDLVDELRIHNELTELRELPESRFLRPFIENAKTWAAENNMSVAAFMEMGVKASTLSEAGFDVKVRSGARVTVEKVRDWILGTDLSEFTKNQIAQATKGSPATVTRAIDAMVEEGLVIKTDRDDPNHSGRGAKAKLFELA